MTKPIEEAQANGAFLKIPFLMAVVLQASLVIYAFTKWLLGPMGVVAGAFVALLLLTLSWMTVGRKFFGSHALRAYEDHLEGCAGGSPFTLPYDSISRLAFDGGSLFFFLKNGTQVAAPAGANFDAPYRVLCEKIPDNPGPPPYFALDS